MIDAPYCVGCERLLRAAERLRAENAAALAELRAAAQHTVDALGRAEVCNHGPAFYGNGEDGEANDCDVCEAMAPLCAALASAVCGRR